MTYLLKTTEEYRADTEREALAIIEEAKKSFALKKQTITKKEVKQKGEIVDEFYVVSFVKIFDDPKEPCGNTEVIYRVKNCWGQEE